MHIECLFTYFEKIFNITSYWFIFFHSFSFFNNNVITSFISLLIFKFSFLFLKNNSLPDSFIVSDKGLIQKLKSEFPDIPLHFSTQFGAHCIDDVNYIKDIGGKRAILARELTKKEITNIKNHSSIELETFIWGSQCLSFSGLCFFGTLINGGGGNRGKCIITCRDVYSTSTDKGHFLYVPDMNWC